MPNPVASSSFASDPPRGRPHQRLLHVNGLTDLGQETADRVELCGRPVVPVDRVVNDPHHARAVGPVQAHDDGVAAVMAGQQLVVAVEVRLILGVQFGAMAQSAVGEVPKARNAFVGG